MAYPFSDGDAYLLVDARGAGAATYTVTPPGTLTDKMVEAEFVYSASVSGYPVDMAGLKSIDSVVEGDTASYSFTISYSLS